MGNRGKYQEGFCSFCASDTALKKTDGTVFRHRNPHNMRVICPGAGKPPSYILVDGDYVKYEHAIKLYDESVVPREAPRVVQPIAVPVPVIPDQRETAKVVVRRIDPLETEDFNQLVGREYPVYTESGTVIGRAHIGVGRITMIGPRWAAKPA